MWTIWMVITMRVLSTSGEVVTTTMPDLNDTVDTECNPLYSYPLYSYESELDTKDIIIRVVTIPIFSIIVIVGFIGNILVLIAMSMGKRKMGITSILLVSLALSDLTIIAFYVPTEMKHTYNPSTSWRFGCRFIPYVGMFAKTSSALMLLSISLERFLVILYPLTSRSFLTRQRTMFLVCLIWCFALIMAVPIVPFMEIETYTFPCYSDWDFSTCKPIFNGWKPFFVFYNLVILYLLPLVVMAICNTTIIVTLVKSSRRSQQMQSMKCLDNNYTSLKSTGGTNSTNGEKRIYKNGKDFEANVEQEHSADDPFPEVQRKKLKTETNNRSNKRHRSLSERRKVMWMLIIVILLYALCWLPDMIRGVLTNVFNVPPNTLGMLVFKIFCSICYCANSAANPIAYGFMSKNFRQSIVYAFQRCTDCKGERRRKSSAYHSAFTLSTRENRNSTVISSYSEKNNIAYSPVSRM